MSIHRLMFKNFKFQTFMKKKIPITFNSKLDRVGYLVVKSPTILCLITVDEIRM